MLTRGCLTSVAGFDVSRCFGYAHQRLEADAAARAARLTLIRSIEKETQKNREEFVLASYRHKAERDLRSDV
jgi:hypothetical protein